MRVATYLFGSLICLSGAAVAQESTSTSDVLFILDGSGSMWGRVNEVEKIVVAKDVMTGLIEGLPEDVDAGLITYGHRERGSCSDIELIATPGETPRSELLSSLSGITPLGKTPISDSLLRAGELLRETENQVSIVLVSDGIESCEGDPCATAALLREQDIDVKIHVVGFDVDAEAEAQLSCIAEAGGGEYYQAGSADALNDALADVRTTIIEEAAVVLPEPEAIPEPEPVIPNPNLELADDVIGTVDVVDVSTSERIGGLNAGHEIEIPAGEYLLEFPNFTSPALTIEAGEDYVVAAADYGLATVRLDEMTIGGVDIHFDESGERLTGQSGTHPQQIPPETYLLKFENFEVPGFIVEPSQEYVISALDYNVAEVALDETVISDVDVYDDGTGERVMGMSGTRVRQILPGTYRFEFQNFTAPPLVVEGGESYTISPNVAEVALDGTVIGDVQVYDDVTGERVTGMSGTRTRQILPGTYRFEFRDFTTPPFVVEGGENYIISPSDYNVAEVVLDGTVIGDVQVYDDVTGERVTGMSGTRTRQILPGTYRFEFRDFTTPPFVVEGGENYIISPSDYNVAEVVLDGTVIGDVQVYDDVTGERVTGMSGTRTRQILPGTYRFEFRDFTTPPFVVEGGENYIISPSDYNVAEVVLDGTVIGDVQVYDDVTGERVTGMSGTRTRQILPGTYRFEFPDFKSPPTTIEGGSNRVIAPSDFGMATVSLADTVEGRVVLLQVGQDPINLSITRPRQIGPGPYTLVHDGEERAIIEIERGENRVIDLQ